MYILQEDDYSCMVITILNAYIHKHNKYPLECDYNSSSYHKFIEDIYKDYDNVENNLNDFAKSLNINRILPDKNRMKTYKSIKSYLIELINNGYLIDFTISVGNLHSCLIVDYDKIGDSFTCINSKFFSFKSAIEHLPLEILVNCNRTKHSYSYRKEYNYIKRKSNCNWNILRDFKILKVN